MESAKECLSREGGEKIDEEALKKKWEAILLRSKEIEEAIKEIKGTELEDGELEEILKELIDLPELIEEDDIPREDLPELVDANKILGDLPLGVEEASIHEGGTFVTENVVRDREIVWPPMVIILNTKLGKDHYGKRLGMENAEVLNYYNAFKAVRSQQSYGPKGHRGIRVLIFKATAMGFMEAERLSKHLEDKGTGRDGWPGCCHQVPLLPSGQPNLYGYMAEKRDMDKFNKYAQGESKLKFEMRSYQEMVVNPMRQMSEDFYLLNWYTNRVAKDKADYHELLKKLPQKTREIIDDHVSEMDSQSRKIVWPPMVLILNTKIGKDHSGKRLGMGNADVLRYFNDYKAVTSRQSYGPKGHRGMSVLIFEASAVGFMEAERLSKHLEDKGTDRDGWSCCSRRVVLLPSGQRNLYGYMAEKEDMDFFNEDVQGESKLKFEMRSYKEMVAKPMKQMSEDNHLLNWYKNRVAKEKMHSKSRKESFGAVCEKLGKTLEENRIVRKRTRMHHEQNEKMDYQVGLCKEQIRLIHEIRNEKEENFEKIQQKKRKKIKRYIESSSAEDYQIRRKKGATWILSHQKEMDNFAEERDKLLKNLEERLTKLKRYCYEENIKLEKEFDAELERLMEKYNPHSFEEELDNMW